MRRVPLRLCALTAAIFTMSLVVVSVAWGGGRPGLAGVQLHSLWFESSFAEMDRELDLSAGAGANVVRVDVVWGSLETGRKGSFSPWYVEKLDRFVAGANARGMKVVATLWSSPCWASSAPESLKQGCAGAWWDRGVGNYPPRDPADYGDAARWLTARYGTRLAAVEVWNEPNLEESWFWKSSDKAGDYARLLRAAYPAAKQGDPRVPVLGGALVFADRPFLEELYRHGVKGFFDGLSIHPYNEWRHPADRWQPQWRKWTLVPGLEWIREAMVAQGDPKPLWLTEFGWTIGTGSGWRVSPAQQADYVGASFGVVAQLPYVESAIVYNLRAKGTDTRSHEDGFGLLDRDFTPRPAYHTLKQALTGQDAQPPKRKRRLTLRLRRGKKSVYAVGRAPARARIALRLSRCKTKRRLKLRTHSTRRGTYRRRVGASWRVSRCRVSARVAGSRTAVAARLPRKRR